MARISAKREIETSINAKPFFTILVVEPNGGDTEDLLHSLESAELKAFDREIDVVVRSTAEGALDVCRDWPVDLVLTDLSLPGISGLSLVSQLQDLDRNLPVLVVTRKRDVDSAVEAMRRGAYDYMLLPISAQDLGAHVHRAIRFSEIMRGVPKFQQYHQQDQSELELVGISTAFQHVLRRIHEAVQGHRGDGQGRGPLLGLGRAVLARLGRGLRHPKGPPLLGIRAIRLRGSGGHDRGLLRSVSRPDGGDGAEYEDHRAGAREPARGPNHHRRQARRPPAEVRGVLEHRGPHEPFQAHLRGHPPSAG